ncbi:MAG: hypothetical protein AMK73_03860 [Planctomycetes bacterium SM23_32]|nr:MAG: hypothetical protein AMK73_03860 [Planctomycetes bacterium SM23_32]
MRVTPQMDRLGPRFKSDAPKVAEALAALDPAEVARAVEAGEAVRVTVGDREVSVEPADVEVRRETPEHLLAADAGPVTVVLDTQITPELLVEGLARDIVRHVQQYRKELDLNIEDRIHLGWAAESEELCRAIAEWRDYVMAETLALRMEPDVGGGPSKRVKIGGAELTIQIRTA